VCQNGEKSAQASAILQARGLKNVQPMRGGILLWMQKGYPVIGKRFEPDGEVRQDAAYDEKDQ